MADQSTTAESPGPAGRRPGRTKLSPRKKQQISWAIQYVVLVVVAVFLLTRVDWGELGRELRQARRRPQMFPELFTVALRNTIIYTVGVSPSAFAARPGARADAAVVGAARTAGSRPPTSRSSAGCPPLLIFLFMVGYGVPLAFPGFEVPGGIYGPVTSASASSPRPTWRRRSGPASRRCPRGSWRRPARSACRTARAMVSIVIPQAFRIVIPPLTNEFVLLTQGHLAGARPRRHRRRRSS